VLQRESEQLHGLQQRLQEHVKQVQDRAFEFVAALSRYVIRMWDLLDRWFIGRPPDVLWRRRSRCAGPSPTMALEQVASRSAF
jgi:hypothetical protein